MENSISINVDSNTIHKLDHLKTNQNESYDTVITKLIENAPENKPLRLFKFMPLANDNHRGRILTTISKGVFWCSKLWNMNDPMEGVFTTIYDKKIISELYKQKNNYVLCSLSHIIVKISIK